MVRGALGAFVVASILTIAVAAPVALAPTQRIFGSEIVGRHHDPFTVMRQMAESGPSAPFIQPVTDWTGWLLARVLHPVAAYNVIVLLTFPLAAASAFALGRYLGAGVGAALIGGLAFAFAPLHLAHAAYHPHIAQVQWLPLYLLALFAAIDRPTIVRLALVVAAAAGLGLSNFYGGLIGAVMTPVALMAYPWLSARATTPRRNALVVLAALAAVTAAVVGAVMWMAPLELRAATSALEFPSSDISRFSARWWAFFVPPVDHPWFGGRAAEVYRNAGVTTGLLEQQVYVSGALLVLAAVGTGWSAKGWRDHPERRPWMALAAVGLAAVVVSVGPGASSCEQSPWAPACALHTVAPMFRSYARFAFVAHLAVALLAGVGAARLTSRSRAGATLAATLLLIGTIEYLPFPSRARDVLPTMAHRWLADKFPDQRTLDCVRPALDQTHVAWLMGRTVSTLGAQAPTCNDPALGFVLATAGYTHVIARHPDRGEWLATIRPNGLAHQATFPDSTVYRVVAAVPPVVTIGRSGFFDFETNGAGDVWRWMSPEGRWRVRNTTGHAIRATLVVELESAGWPRALTASFDAGPATGVTVATGVAQYVLGRWVVAPGDHTLAFTASERPLRPDEFGYSTDTRRLTVSFRRPLWLSDSPDDEAR